MDIATYQPNLNKNSTIFIVFKNEAIGAKTAYVVIISK